MANFQDKFQKGLTSIQDGFKKGKDKVVTSQEIMSLKLKISELEKEEKNLFESLGIATYNTFYTFLDTPLENEELNKLVEEITELKEKINELQSQIDQKNKTNELRCECGTELSSTDKFCKNCGKPVI